MKKLFLLVFVLFAWNIFVNAQDSDARYVEVIGSSEVEIVPDEIHFLIQIKEYWKKNIRVNQRKRKTFGQKCHWL